jgi:hypothetical protein
MGLTTEGGSGNGSVALAALSYVQQTICTTPNTTNSFFIVTVTWAMDATAATVVSATVGGWGLCTANSHGGPLVIKVGPNTAVRVTFQETANAAGTLYYSYNYVGVVVT